MTRFWLVLVVLGAALRASGQTYFNERYPIGGGRFSGATALAPADSGGVVLVGQAEGPNSNGDLSLLVQGLTGTGRLRWMRFYHRPGYQLYPSYSAGLTRLADGGYAMAGAAADTQGIGTAYLWRFTARGDTLWTRRFTQASGLGVIAYSCRQTADAGLVVVGIQEHRVNGVRVPAVWLARTDSSGGLRWERTYAIGGYDYGYSVELAPDGGYVVSGLSYPTGPPLTQNDGLVLKVDSLGQEQWHRLLGTPFEAEGAYARPTRDGGYIVAGNQGTVLINQTVQSRPAFYKLDAQGQVLWQRAYGPSRNETALLTIHELADGSFVAAGQQGRLPTASQVAGRGSPEGIILKVCADGDSLWYRTYQQLTGGNSSNYMRDLLPQPDGSFIAVGFLHVRPPDTGSPDVWAFKIDSAGYLQSGGTPVTVQCRPLGTGLTSPAPGVEVWPNPSPDGRYALRLGRAGQAEVVDAVGRVVWRGELAAGVSELDLRALPAGVYGLRVSGLRPQLIIKNE